MGESEGSKFVLSPYHLRGRLEEILDGLSRFCLSRIVLDRDSRAPRNGAEFRHPLKYGKGAVGFSKRCACLSNDKVSAMYPVSQMTTGLLLGNEQMGDS